MTAGAIAAPGADKLASKKTPAGLPLRLLAIARLRDVLTGSAFIPFSATEIAEGRDRALANRLVTTALRHQGHLNFALSELLDKGMPAKSGSFEAVLRLSLAQLLYLPDLGAHSAIFLAVEALKNDKKAQHLTGLMNAVLRRAQGSGSRYWDLPSDLLFPKALREHWIDLYGEDAVADFGIAMIDGAPLDLTMKNPEPVAVETLGGSPIHADSVRIETRDRPVEALPGYTEGEWWVQDAASALPARLLGLAPGARVLDLCAAPGGKTAQLIKAGYSVTALDNDAGRLTRLKTNLDRLNYAAEVVEADAGQFKPETLYDGILLDAPCSATGTFRRHPEVVWHRTEADINGRVTLQRRLIANAVKCLNPGGVLIYCTCSLEAEEGENQAEWVKQTMPDLEQSAISPSELGELGFAVTPEGLVRTHPGQTVPGEAGGTLDGFFVARFRRKGL
jgi:16S rRNA (cytosine967-C5)-methyltransferase